MNKDHSKFSDVDIITDWIARLPKDEQAAAKELAEKCYAELLQWRESNPEQRKALEKLRKCPGGLSLTLGFAGTGKTLLQQGVAIAFEKMGLHVLSLAPANSNVDDFATKLHDVAPELPQARLQSSRVDNSLSTMALYGKAMPEPYKSRIIEFDVAVERMEELKDRGADARHLGFQAHLLDAARGEENQGQFLKAYTDKRGNAVGDPVDVWQELSRAVSQLNDDTFDWDDEEQRTRLKQCYFACMDWLIRRTKMVSSTTTNARAPFFRKNWASGKHDTECKGVLIQIDEAAKEFELNLYIALFEEHWNTKVVGVILLEDTQQSSPTYTCSRGKVQHSPLVVRGDMTLLARLESEGFRGMNYLWDQIRMHPEFAEYPGKRTYQNKLWRSEQPKASLNDVRPRLAAALKRILIKLGVPKTQLKSEKKLRVDCFVKKGERRQNSNKGSSVVVEHADFFIKNI